MAVREKPNSRKWSEGETKECEYLFQVSGTNNDLLIKAEALAYAPLIINDGVDDLWRQTVQLQRINWQVWDVTIPYKKTEPKEIGWSQVSFELTMQTAKVTQSLAYEDPLNLGLIPPAMLQATTGYAPGTATAPDYKGAIGVNKDGKVEGCEILVPEFTWSETWRHPTAIVESLAYRNILYAIGLSPLNDAVFRDFAGAEVLFMAASDSRFDKTQSDVTYKFKASPNMTNLTIGDITVAEKLGHDYLDIRYAEKVDPVSKVRVAVPKYAYVHTMYCASDFSLMGIGT